MDLTKTSRFLSLILRHKPEEIGISLDEHGWANVSDLLRGMREAGHPISKTILEEIVATDDKQRYSFDKCKTRIRANQGHSIPVDVELEEAVPPKYLWHGTGKKYVDSIYDMGLIPKSRLYVHLSSDTETASTVGERHGDMALFCVNAREMYENGHIFYLSKNGVWLTKHVPVTYLSRYNVYVLKGENNDQ